MKRAAALVLMLVLVGCSQPSEPAKTEAPLSPEEAAAKRITDAKEQMQAEETTRPDGAVFKAIREHDPALYEKLAAAVGDPDPAPYNGYVGLDRAEPLIDRALAAFPASDAMTNEMSADDLRKQRWYMTQNPTACTTKPPITDKELLAENLDVTARTFASTPEPGAKTLTPYEIVDWMKEVAAKHPEYAAAMDSTPMDDETRAKAVCGLYLATAEELAKMPPDKRAATYRGMAAVGAMAH